MWPLSRSCTSRPNRDAGVSALLKNRSVHRTHQTPDPWPLILMPPLPPRFNHGPQPVNRVTRKLFPLHVDHCQMCGALLRSTSPTGRVLGNDRKYTHVGIIGMIRFRVTPPPPLLKPSCPVRGELLLGLEYDGWTLRDGRGGTFRNVRGLRLPVLRGGLLLWSHGTTGG